MTKQIEILDLEGLSRLANAAGKDGQHIYMHGRDSNNWAANAAFVGATSPDVVLALIAEIDVLRANTNSIECRYEVSENTLKTIRGCLRQAEGDIDVLRDQIRALQTQLAEA